MMYTFNHSQSTPKNRNNDDFPGRGGGHGVLEPEGGDIGPGAGGGGERGLESGGGEEEGDFMDEGFYFFGGGGGGAEVRELGLDAGVRGDGDILWDGHCVREDGELIRRVVRYGAVCGFNGEREGECTKGRGLCMRVLSRESLAVGVVLQRKARRRRGGA